MKTNQDKIITFDWLSSIGCKFEITPLFFTKTKEVFGLDIKLNHYQKLYENRVKKDLGLENKDQATQTSLTTEQVNKLTSQWKQVSQWAQELGIDTTQQWNLALLKEKVNHLSHQSQQEQLRKINVLFDEQAQDYQFIDFQGLYSLLSQIAERERESKIVMDTKLPKNNEQIKLDNSHSEQIKPVFSRYRKKKRF